MSHTSLKELIIDLKSINKTENFVRKSVKLKKK